MRRISTLIALESILLSCSFSTIYAQSFVGTAVSAVGDVKELKPAKSGESDDATLRFEGKDYHYKRVKIGSKLTIGDMIFTGPNGRAKIVYQNGDHLMVGPSSAIFLPVPKSAGKSAGGSSSLNIIYGKVRALISHDGPRNNMQIKSPLATSGVRGTDFYLSAYPTTQTELIVFRGKVELKPTAENANQEATVLSAGKAAKVEKDSPQIDVKEVSKEKLIEVQETTAIVATEARRTESLPSDLRKEIDQLNKASTEMVLTDIRSTSPELLSKLDSAHSVDADQLNQAVISDLYKEAPREDPNTPLRMDAYKRYFREQ